MSLLDGVFHEVGGSIDGNTRNAVDILTGGGLSGGPLSGGRSGGRRRGGNYGPQKLDPNGYPMMARDGRLASKNFGADVLWLNLIPQHKFLFFVRFIRPLDMGRDTQDVGVSKFAAGNQSDRMDWSKGVGFSLKKIDQPSVNFKVETLNQYNKKRNVQTGVEFGDITLTFYDTYDLRVRMMFQEYFQFYYGDGRKYNGDFRYDVAYRDLEGGSRPEGSTQWGLCLDGKTPETSYFFSHMEIYQFWQGQYIQCNLINPKIVTYDPDHLTYEDGGITQEITMKIKFDGIVYHNQGKKQKIGQEMLEWSGLKWSDFYEPESGPPTVKAFGSPWPKPPGVGQPDILGNLLGSVVGAAISGKGNISQVATRSVLGSFGNFAFGSGGMSGGNNVFGSVLRGGTNGALSQSGYGGAQMLGGALTGGSGIGGSGGLGTLAALGAVSAVSGIFNNDSPGTQVGSREQPLPNGSSYDPNTGITWNPETGSYTPASNTVRGMAAENGVKLPWQQAANVFNSGSAADVQQATYSTANTAINYQQATYQYGVGSQQALEAKSAYEKMIAEERALKDANNS